MSSNLPFNKEAFEKLASDTFRNLFIVSLLFLGLDLLVLPDYVDFYIGKERMIFLSCLSAYIYVFLHMRELERKNKLRFNRSNKLITYTFLALIASTVFCHLPYLISSRAAIPVVTATLGLGLVTLYLRKSETPFSYTLHPTRTGKTYVISREALSRFLSLLFYSMLLLAILNITVYWYPLTSVRLQVTKITPAVGTLFIYFNREQIYHYLQSIQNLDRNDSRLKIIGNFAIYLNKEWLTPFTQCIQNFDQTNPRHERINKISSHLFLGLLLALAIESNASLFLSETLKTPVTLTTLLLGTVTCYLKKTGPISSFLHKRNHEKKQELRYSWIDDAIPSVFYLLLTLTLVYHLPWALSNLKTEIMVAAILFGVFTFYLNRDKLENIEEEKLQEELEENKRKAEFAEKYPRIDRVWGVRWIGKWMYKEGWYSVMLLLLVLIGFGLRIWNLDFLTPFKDEYYHLIGAKRFMIEGTFNYPRAKFLTYIIGILFKLNGETSLFLGRLPSVIFGTLSIIAIYFLAKQINKKVGIISSYLIVFSPFSIGMSRFLREYQVYFLVILTFIYYLVYFLSAYDINTLLYKNKIKPKLLIQISILIIPAIYYILIERVAMVIELYAISIIFLGTYIIFSLDKDTVRKILHNKKAHIILISISIVSILLLIKFTHDFNWLIKIGTIKEFQYKKLFFHPDFVPYNIVYLQWFSGSNYSKSFAISLFILPLIYYYKNKYYISSVLAFLMIYIVFVYIVNRYYAPRYVYYAFPFYFIIYACAAYSLIYSKKIFSKRYLYTYVISIFIILVSFFNPFTGVNGLMSEEWGITNPNDNLIHRNISELQDYLEKNNFSEKETLITANGYLFQYYYNYSWITNRSEWPLKRFEIRDGKFVYDYGNYYDYNYILADQMKQNFKFMYEKDNQVYSLDENERINEIILKYEKGWIVIDKDRNHNWNKNGIPLNNYTIVDKNIQYMGSTSGYRGFDIYRWNITT